MEAEQSPDDPGRAAERTALAWNRSGLAVVLCVAVLLRRLWPIKSGHKMVTVVIVAFAAIVWAVAILTLGSIRSSRSERRPLGTAALGLMTVATLVLAAGAITVTFLVSG